MGAAEMSRRIYASRAFTREAAIAAFSGVKRRTVYWCGYCMKYHDPWVSC